jgi:hypothetical protein
LWSAREYSAEIRGRQFDGHVVSRCYGIKKPPEGGLRGRSESVPVDRGCAPLLITERHPPFELPFSNLW